MRIADLAAMFVHMSSVFMLLCLLGNAVSMFAPVAMKSGTMQVARPTAKVMLIQFIAVFMFPMTLLPSAACLGIGLAVEHFAIDTFGLLHLAVSVVLLGITVPTYHFAIRWQGDLLLWREKAILEAVTKVAD